MISNLCLYQNCSSHNQRTITTAVVSVVICVQLEKTHVQFHARCVQRQMPWFSVQKTAKVPQLQRSLRWPMSLLCRSSWCRRCSAVVNVPVIIQRQVSSLQQWRCLRFSSPAESWTFPLCNRDWYAAFLQRRYGGGEGAFLTHFCVIFRAPLVVPELSASFWSLRW